MRYLSLCSGIEAASVAFKPLGWEPTAFAEIEPFPCAVLAHHYPDVPNLGDMTRFKEWDIGAVDIIVGGTPCQSFSVAGLRGGLADKRGNLSLTFCEIADHFNPPWVLWENVPGVLSSKDNAFGCFLAGLSGASAPLVSEFGWDNAGLVTGPNRTVAWRVLDAQFFGVAQRRRRVFVLAVRGAGNWAGARALFPVGEGVFWDSAPRREAREGVAGGVEIGPGGGRFTDLNPTLDTRAKDGPIRNQLAGAVLQPYAVGNTLTARMHKGINSTLDEGQTPVLHPLAFPANLSATQCASAENLAPAMGAKNPTAVAFTTEQTPKFNEEQALTLTKQSPTGGGQPQAVMQAMQVRRLTPVECERLQGFPENYTAIPWRKKPASECPDGPRYKALGNSWAVPVVRWIGERIDMQGA